MNKLVILTTLTSILIVLIIFSFGFSRGNQNDADHDGIVDSIDNDTIYGYLVGDVKSGIDVNVFCTSCSNKEIMATLITDNNGYFSIGNLGKGFYVVQPHEYDYMFSPNIRFIEITENKKCPLIFE